MVSATPEPRRCVAISSHFLGPRRVEGVHTPIMSRNNTPSVADAANPPNQLLSQSVDTPETPSAWQGLQADVPTLRSRTEIASFAECVLVELRHEPVGVRFLSAPHHTTEWVICRADHLTVAPDHPFVRVWVDERHGVAVEPCSRADVREQLCHTLENDQLGCVDVQPLVALSLDKLSVPQR